jgi:hypothetical protein
MKLKRKILAISATLSSALTAILILALMLWRPEIRTIPLIVASVVFFAVIFTIFKNSLDVNYSIMVSAEAEGDKPLF